MLPVKIEELILTGKDVQRDFQENYVATLYQKHCLEDGLDIKYLKNFIHTAQVTNADPRKNQIYLIARNVKLKTKKGEPEKWGKVGTIVYSYGYTLGLVQSHKDYKGMSTEIVTKKVVFPKFKITTNHYGKEEYEIDGTEEKTEIVAICTMFRGDKPYTYEALLSDYFDKSSEQWRKKYSYMLRKCAEVGCARHAFADIVQGFYTEEEFVHMEQDAIEATSVQVEDKQRDQIVEQKMQKEIDFQEKVKCVDEFAELLASIQNYSAILTAEMKTLDQKGEWMSENLGVNVFSDLKKASIEHLRKLNTELGVQVRLSYTIKDKNGIVS